MKISLKLLLLLFSASSVSHAQLAPTSVESSGTIEKVGAKISLPAEDFLDPAGHPVHLSHYFHQSIPLVFGIVKDQSEFDRLEKELSPELSKLAFSAAKPFEIVILSPQKLAPRPDWNLLTGKSSNLAELKNELGTTHALAPTVSILKPDGEIYRYLYEGNLHEKDIKFALIGASEKKLGTLFDRFLFYCFHFDSLRHSYTIDLWRIVGVVLAIQALIVVVMITLFWKRKVRV